MCEREREYNRETDVAVIREIFREKIGDTKKAKRITARYYSGSTTADGEEEDRGVRRGGRDKSKNSTRLSIMSIRDATTRLYIDDVILNVLLLW